MKTIHIAIITITALVAVTISTLVLTDQFHPSGNFHIIKIQKILDDGTMWKLIHPKNNENAEYVVTEGIDWSDDGKQLAFGVNAGAPVSYLWVMNADGVNPEPANIPIEFNSVSDIHISDRDNSVFFVGQYNSNNETYQDIFKYYMNNKTYSFVTTDSHVRNIGYLSDGKIIYVESHSNATRLEKEKPIFLIKSYAVLWITDGDGHKIKPIYNGTQLFTGMTPSPDGNKIAFVSRDDPLHPSSNGTDIVNFLSLGGSLTDYQSYFTIFDIDSKKFTIMEKATNDDFVNLKWLPDGDRILYETLTHHCVKDKAPGTQSCPAGLLNLMTVSSHSSEVIYGNQGEPYTAPLVGTAISPDGRSIIFGINYDYSNDEINGKGIYKMTFDRPLYLK